MNSFTIARRDIAAYLHGYAGFVIIAGILFVEGMLFNFFAMGSDSARYSHEVLEDFFYFQGGCTMVAAILFTMRTIAEERTEGTDVLLITSTASDGQIVFGKYIGAMAILTLMTALTLYMPGLIFVNGKVSLAHIAVGYLGVMGLGSVCTAIGIFGSTIFRSQLASGVITTVVVVTFLTSWLAAEFTEPPFSDVLAHAAIFNQHFIPFQEGRLTLSSLVYYASITAVFLVFAKLVINGRRWE